MLKLLKPKTGENMRENTEEETRSFYTPISVKINPTQNKDPNASRNNRQDSARKFDSQSAEIWTNY